VRNDGTPDAAYVGNGDGNSLPEQYVAYIPGDLASKTPVQPGQTAILRSRLTGKFCKLTVLPPGTQQGMVCDQDTAGTATVFKYTGQQFGSLRICWLHDRCAGLAAPWQQP
jgi:hypothetical protein